MKNTRFSIRCHAIFSYNLWSGSLKSPLVLRYVLLIVQKRFVIGVVKTKWQIKCHFILTTSISKHFCTVNTYRKELLSDRLNVKNVKKCLNLSFYIFIFYMFNLSLTIYILIVQKCFEISFESVIVKTKWYLMENLIFFTSMVSL